jgi:hypothetical protein
MITCDVFPLPLRLIHLFLQYIVQLVYKMSSATTEAEVEAKLAEAGRAPAG